MKTDNEIIAEFMGVMVFQTYADMQVFPLEQLKQWLLPEQMKYDTSWDWLMPVVEKIAELGINDRSPDGVIVLSDYYRMLTDMSIISKRDWVYGKVVEFIKFYNQQSK